MEQSARQKVIKLVGKAIGDFDLINGNDRILVALSGGKDSWALLLALKELQNKAPVKFEIGVVTIHPGHSVFDPEPLIQRLTRDHISHEVLYKGLTDIVNDNLTPGTNPCSFCSRLRRGILYTYAAQNNWNKIALGHHADDFIETLMLNLIFNGSIKGMSPKLEADDGRNIIIRPLVYVNESQTKAFAIENKLPLLDCSCPFEGGSNHRRKWVKNLISEIEQDAPNVKSSMLSAMGRIHTRHLLQTEVVSPSPKAD